MTARPIARLTRIAWLFTFVVPLVLAVLLLGVKSAPALPPATASASAELEEEFEFEEGEQEEEACEVAEGELEEGELSEAEAERICEENDGEDKKKAAASDSVAPEECLLRSAHARLVASDSRKGVRLTVGYTAYEPTAATIDYRLEGGKGSLHLGAAKRHLGRSGVIRLTKTLGDLEMARVEAADHFTVRLHIAEAPADCRRFETKQLIVTHTSERQIVWSQTD